MTFKQQRMIDKLKRYFDNEDEYNYKSVVGHSINDPAFEKYVQSITVDRIAGKSGLAKHKCKQNFYYWR